MTKKKSSEILGDRWHIFFQKFFRETPKKRRSKISAKIWLPRFWSSGSASVQNSWKTILNYYYLRLLENQMLDRTRMHEQSLKIGSKWLKIHNNIQKPEENSRVVVF